MDQPLPVHTFYEAKYYLMVNPCPNCGSGPWQIDTKQITNDIRQLITTAVHCEHCTRKKVFTFSCQETPAESDQSIETINPTSDPSKIVDLSQWLSLFQMLVESAASSDDKPETRRQGYRAALCLSEALKFYKDNELPPESAFFSDESLSIFRKHPEEFARQRLRDMQVKLPTLPRIARAVEKDTHRETGRWWQFWK